MSARFSRRTVLGVLPAALAKAFSVPKKPKSLPKAGEFTRLVDPTTETTLFRLTAPTSTAELPHPDNRFISARGRFLVFSSNRTGAFAPYHLDLHSGILQMLAEPAKLEVRSLTLDQAERSLLFLDGDQVKEIALGGRKQRVLADGARQFAIGRTAQELLVVRGDSLEHPDGKKLAAHVESLVLLDSAAGRFVFTRRPSPESLEFWAGETATGLSQKLAAGAISFPFWSPDQQAVLFLQTDERAAHVVQVDLSGGSKQTVSATGPLACFAPNADATVFTAALRSKAQPLVMLMLRSPRRELALCEHASTDPAGVTPIFSPDSRRIFFQSNREGKNAIYAVDVSPLVEPTETGEQ